MLYTSHSDRSFAGLVDQLDERLPREEIIVLDGPAVRRGRTLPTWAAFLLICTVFVGAGWYILKPTQSTCEFSETICAIEDLDIDALLLTIPDAELFRVLPSIDEIDPADELTLRDILSMDQFSDLDIESLISASELDRVLNQMD